MIQIISKGEVIAICEALRYIRRKPESGCFVQTDAEHAEGIAANGTPYNINGVEKIEGAEMAYTSEIDGGGKLLETEHTANSTAEIVTEIEDALCEQDVIAETLDETITAVEDAICEQDIITDERISAIEDALCELDK